MKKLLKISLCVILTLAFLVSVLPFSALADTNKTHISLSPRGKLKVGGILNVTVSFDAAVEFTGASCVLNYSTDCLEFVSAENSNLKSPGTVKLAAGTSGAKIASFNLKFKAKAAGSATVKVIDCFVSTADEEYTVKGSTVPGIIILAGNEGTKPSENSSSSNAHLKFIKVAEGNLTPAFSPDVTKYSVTVPYSRTDGILYCESVDKNCRFSVKGSRELKVGLNERSIIVTAPDGTEKTYTVVFNRLDENGKDISVKEEKPEADISYNGNEYYLTGDFEKEELPTGFSVGICNYNGEEVACITNASKSLTALCLVNAESEEKEFFLYDKEKGFSDFNYIETQDGIIVILDLENDFDFSEDYSVSSVEINGKQMRCYIKNNESFKDFAVLRAIDSNDNVGYYRYDKLQKTIQRFPEFTHSEPVRAQYRISNLQRYTVIILAVIFAELIIALIVVGIILIVKSVKKKSKIQAESYETQEILEETDSEENSDGWIK